MHPAPDTRDLPAASHPAPESNWTPRWTNQGLNQLGHAFLTRLDPTPLAAPRLLAYSSDMAQHLGMSPAWLASDDSAELLTGNRIAPGSQPYATVYSGHQFGVWAGQLGDGRAILLGEVADTQQPDQGWELQLKGAGPTPYSRRGDGRAVLRSSIREFLCSEAMHALGIPTTRALSLTASPAPVYREEAETAAVVCRAAPSFIRFGHFEHFAARGQEDELRQLADYVIDRYYPECRAATGSPAAASPYAALLRAVAERTADMLAHWQAVGFCHGVMNTDNMSILGLTIDYGPFQFLDTFDPEHICNHSDTQGRYAFRQQPQVAYWNLFCLGQALHPLIGEEDATVAAIEAYRPRFAAAFAALMRRKLGLPAWKATAEAADDASNPIVAALLQLLADQQVDYPIFWTRLTEAAASGRYDGVRDLFIAPIGFDTWLLTYQELLAQENTASDADLMQKSNPRFVLRNHLGELVIRAARTGDASVLQQLQAVLASPFDAHPAHSAWEGFPPDWASSISISCSS